MTYGAHDATVAESNCRPKVDQKCKHLRLMLFNNRTIQKMYKSDKRVFLSFLSFCSRSTGTGQVLFKMTALLSSYRGVQGNDCCTALFLDRNYCFSIVSTMFGHYCRLSDHLLPSCLHHSKMAVVTLNFKMAVNSTLSGWPSPALFHDARHRRFLKMAVISCDHRRHLSSW